MAFTSQYRRKPKQTFAISTYISQNQQTWSHATAKVCNLLTKNWEDPTTAESEKKLSDVLQPLSGDRDIRLARLKQSTGLNDEQLEIDLETWSLDADPLPHFCALSYTWNSGKYSVDANGNAYIHYGGDRYSITGNLYQALGFLRSPDEDRYFWVDQICIRQHDNEEKSRQIPLMREIYARASDGVIAWLGPEDDHAPALLQYISRVVDKQLWDDGKSEFDEVPDVASGVKAIIKFVSRDWFNRIWIVQEATSQKHGLKLQFNEFSIPFSDLVAAVNHTNHLLIDQDPTTSVPTDGRVTYYSFLRGCPTIDAVGQAGSETLQELVQKFCTWNGSEPRDKIYAFLGMASDRALYPRPDYNLSLEQIYRDFAAIWMGHDIQKVLASLTFAVAGYGPMQDQPSWVPNWQHFGTSNPISPLRNNYKFAAGGAIEPDAAYTFDGKCVSLKGVVVDRIVAVSEVFDRHSIRNRSWLESARKIIKESTSLTDEAEIDKTLGRLLVLDGKSSLYELSGEEGNISPLVIHHELTGVDAENPPFAFSAHGLPATRGMPGREYLRLGANPYAATYESPSLWPKLDLDGDDHADGALRRTPAYRAYKDAVVAINLQQRLFCTGNGRVGIGNARIAESHEVVILRGARMPFVVRKADDGYRLISEAYVRDIMHGEAVEDVKWEEIGIV